MTTTTELAGSTIIITVRDVSATMAAVLAFASRLPRITVSRDGDDAEILVGDGSRPRDLEMLRACMDSPEYAAKMAAWIEDNAPAPTSQDCPTCGGPAEIAGQPCDGCTEGR